MPLAISIIELYIEIKITHALNYLDLRFLFFKQRYTLVFAKNTIRPKKVPYQPFLNALKKVLRRMFDYLMVGEVFFNGFSSFRRVHFYARLFYNPLVFLMREALLII